MAVGDGRRIGVRSGTHAEWQSVDTSPGSSLGIWEKEIIFVTDKKSFKIGDGTNDYDGLDFAPVDADELGSAAFAEDIPEVPGSGTAATRDVTTDPYDTDTSLVAILGTAGWASSGDSAQDVSNINELTASGLYRPVADATGLPDADTNAGHLLHMQRTPSIAFQILCRSGDNKMRIRHKTGTESWEDWSELYHTGNAPSDDAWTTIDDGSLLGDFEGTVRYIKRLGVVTIMFNGIANTGDFGDDDVYQLSSAYRPDKAVLGAVFKDSTYSPGRVEVTPDGMIKVSLLESGAFRGYVTYPVI